MMGNSQLTGTRGKPSIYSKDYNTENDGFGVIINLNQNRIFYAGTRY